MRIVLLGVAVLAFGCGKKPDETQREPARSARSAPTHQDAPKPGSTPTKPSPSTQPSIAPKPEPKPESKLPQTLIQQFQGRNAADWGQELLDADLGVSENAAVALRTIGPEGLRFAIPGLESRYPAIRLRALATAISPPDARPYQEVFGPIFIRLLADESPIIRGWAALMIDRCEYRSLSGEIESALTRETNAEVRRQMTVAIQEMKKK